MKKTLTKSKMHKVKVKVAMKNLMKRVQVTLNLKLMKFQIPVKEIFLMLELEQIGMNYPLQLARFGMLLLKMELL